MALGIVGRPIALLVYTTAKVTTENNNKDCEKNHRTIFEVYIVLTDEYYTNHK
jgi:hypothetical protein